MPSDGECSEDEIREAAAFFADSDDEIVDFTVKKHFNVSKVAPPLAVPPITAVIERVCLHPASEQAARATPSYTPNVTLTPAPHIQFAMQMQDPRYGPMHHALMYDTQQLTPMDSNVELANMKAMMAIKAAHAQFGLASAAFNAIVPGKGAGKGIRRPPLGKLGPSGIRDRTGIEEFLAWALSPKSDDDLIEVQ